MSSFIPVLLAPTSLTKHLKVSLDKAGWRDKTRLITRYTQITSQTKLADQSNPTLHHDGYDFTSYMAMALLPVGPFESLQGSDTNGRISLWELLQGLSSTSQSSFDLPADISDPFTLKSIFLITVDSSAFMAPKHLLVQTPLEKLQQGVSDFLTPYLQAWGQAHPDNNNVSDSNEPRLSLDDLPQLLASLPQKWEHYSDFTLLPPTAFLSAPWPTVMKRLVALDKEEEKACAGSQSSEDIRIMTRWEKLVQDSLQSSHIARKAIIPVNDILRRPKIRPLTGDWKLHNQYKSWIEEDLALLEHRNVESISTVPMVSESPDTTPMDTLPTEENFHRAYWAETCQNQVWYSWAPMFTMFSAGNITEKERVAKSRPIFEAKGKTVVDLYAGVGYFSLVYLVHAGAKTVHACEWNPWSVEGLVRGANKNKIRWKKYITDDDSVVSTSKGPATARDGGLEKGNNNNQGIQQQQQSFQASPVVPVSTPGGNKKQKSYGDMVVYQGDNAKWINYFENQAHHVNLGLIPSAEPGWVLGVRALCPEEGGYLHVHHNIRVGEEESFKMYLLESLRDLFAIWKSNSTTETPWSIHIRHVENVKSFAPVVFHYVIDVECRPPSFVGERT
ncbi:tRNA wybutosine-synthesizing protein 2 [Mortierella sp. GBA30]|nr:tRNA wybutosine-synthesizing protein 2 [Mortierella sp. GBA30]